MIDTIASMSVSDLIKYIAAGIVALSAIIQISPIKLNPWSWIARKIGKAVNHDLIEKVEGIEADIKELHQVVDEREAKAARDKILEFGDELIYNPERRHSKDQFDNIVQRITDYDKYCDEHPNFKNHMTASTTKMILDIYEKCMREHKFL